MKKVYGADLRSGRPPPGVEIDPGAGVYFRRTSLMWAIFDAGDAQTVAEGSGALARFCFSSLAVLWRQQSGS
jgi:hypothetical protein